MFRAVAPLYGVLLGVVGSLALSGWLTFEAFARLPVEVGGMRPPRAVVLPSSGGEVPSQLPVPRWKTPEFDELYGPPPLEVDFYFGDGHLPLAKPVGDEGSLRNPTH